MSTILKFFEEVHSVVRHSKVIILGAGASGIAAARQLQSNNINDFVIIDALPFVGGRVQNATFGGAQVELGANWIYGHGDNPIHKLAVKHGLQTVPSDKSNVTYFDHTGKRIAEKEEKEFNKALKDIGNLAKLRMQRGLVDLSARTALQLEGWHANSSLRAAIEYFGFDWELAEPPEVTSLDYAAAANGGSVIKDQPDVIPGDDFVIDERGFQYILRAECDALLGQNTSRLVLSTKITDVHYGPDNVTVFASNGDIFVADVAICTFPLAVLQSGNVKFHPSFPSWKREALFNFHATTYTKIWMRFSKRFWPLDTQFFVYADPVSRGHYPVWQTMPHLDEPILMATVVYHESQRVEQMSTKSIQKEVTQVLKRMFGPEATAPVEILVPVWKNNPLFGSSYSNWGLGMSEAHHRNLRRRLGRLWFAGEAMSRQYFGFLHGAWMDGLEVATAVEKCLLTSCEKQPDNDTGEEVNGCEADMTSRFVYQGLHL
ncbi:hypothetical protein INT44_003485 [Umbelopsis vinacea]|uniref:Amine oxidase domain-containing protein n=1 Tax=Umbelopsis vinacea TaxID=44442 RepID=A0A8H7PWI7_9FUNG|nr:hypothetical protein INT44_003485 [Umbelopsis vinacea]